MPKNLPFAVVEQPAINDVIRNRTRIEYDCRIRSVISKRKAKQLQTKGLRRKAARAERVKNLMRNAEECKPAKLFSPGCPWFPVAVDADVLERSGIEAIYLKAFYIWLHQRIRRRKIERYGVQLIDRILFGIYCDRRRLKCRDRICRQDRFVRRAAFAARFGRGCGRFS